MPAQSELKLIKRCRLYEKIDYWDYDKATTRGIYVLYKKENDAFNQYLRYLRVAIYSELGAEYKKEMDLEQAEILAAQVVNYLGGEDIESIYNNAAEPNKSKIGKIKDQIKIRAEKKMNDDKCIRELIVYTLRMKNVFQFSNAGEKYLDSVHKKNIDQILLKYGAEFPKEANTAIYKEIFTRFFEQKDKYISGESRNNVK